MKFLKFGSVYVGGFKHVVRGITRHIGPQTELILQYGELGGFGLVQQTISFETDPAFIKQALLLVKVTV